MISKSENIQFKFLSLLNKSYTVKKHSNILNNILSITASNAMDESLSKILKVLKEKDSKRNRYFKQKLKINI